MTMLEAIPTSYMVIANQSILLSDHRLRSFSGGRSAPVACVSSDASMDMTISRGGGMNELKRKVRPRTVRRFAPDWSGAIHDDPVIC